MMAYVNFSLSLNFFPRRFFTRRAREHETPPKKRAWILLLRDCEIAIKRSEAEVASHYEGR